VAKKSRQMGESILLQRLLRGTQGENRNWEREKNHHQSILFYVFFFLHHDNSASSCEKFLENVFQNFFRVNLLERPQWCFFFN